MSSSSRLPLAPDPDKWLTARKVDKPLKQRPLVSSQFKAHHGVATPPSTGRKRGSASNKAAPAAPSSSASTKRRAPNATPTAPIRGIASYLTPTSADVKRPSATAARAKLPKPPAVRTPSLDPNTDASVTAWMATLPRTRPVEEPVKSSGAPRTPDVPPLSLRDLTPVPDDILARHRRLCGQDSARRTTAVSPWRRGQETEEDKEAAKAARAVARKEADERMEAERERKRRRLDVREAVAGEALHRVNTAKERRALGEFKSLVQLTSSADGSSSPLRDRESSPSERQALAQKAGPNTTLRRYTSALENPVGHRDSAWPSKQSNTTPRHFPPLQTASSRPPRSPVTTPRKQRSTQHHNVTPPKSLKSHTPRKYDEQQETLFVFPAPPRQPVFKQPALPKPVSGWEPVDMEPETLITWSLGGETLEVASPPGTVPHQAVAQPPVELRFAAPLSAIVEDDDADSIAPSIPSQSFPHLLDSSPSPDERHSRSPTRAGSTPPRLPDFPAARSLHRKSSATVPESFVYVASRSPSPSSPSPQKRLIRRVGDIMPPKRGFFSSITDMQSPAASESNSRLLTLTKGSTPKAAPRRTKTQDKSQSKLESFGYFPSKTRAVADFVEAFSDEEDLDFGDEPVAFASPLSRTGLVPVPDAPPHPALRPAGIREMAKRQTAAMDRHLGQSSRHPQSPVWSAKDDTASHGELPQSDPLFSTDTSSSLPSDDGPRISESTRAWWDKLGEMSEMSDGDGLTSL